MRETLERINKDVLERRNAMAVTVFPENKQFVCEGYQIMNGSTHKFYVVTKSANSHELLVYADNGQIISGYLVESVNAGGELVEVEKCYVNKDAKNIYSNIKAALKGCKQKENRPTMHAIGACTANSYKKKDKTCEVVKFMGELVELDFRGDDFTLVVNYYGLVSNLRATTGIDFTNLGLSDLYVELKRAKAKKESTEESDVADEWGEVAEALDVPIRTLEEIALEKDITWLHNKKYYVINDEAQAEQLLQAFEKWNGVISYDVETSGLHINMFGQIGSPRVDELREWNEKNPKERIKQDYLVGFSLTVEKNVGYYFPCAHRKFKNLYEDRSEGSYGFKLAQRLKSEYTIGIYRDRNDYMAQYIRKTNIEDIGCDVLLMERCRYIFETKDILAFNGIFEWKTTWLFSIDLNLREDPMILHQLLYKFKRIRVGRGEPSNLKYLTKVECGVDQLDLADFFVGYKDDDSNELRGSSASGGKKKKKSKKGLNIDFSYMDLKGTQAYAPADVDFALAIWEKYKYDLIKNYPEMEYIYGVEILMACAVAYAEFYGLRINEDKIEAVRKKNIVDIAMYEHKFRKLAGLCSPEEEVVAQQLAEYMEGKDEADDTAEGLANKMNDIIKELGNLNMGAPQQVGDLLYNKYNWPLTEDGKKSMGKKVIKQYEKAMDEDGNLLYPEVSIYRKYKDATTLDTKFFGKLREFTYPGGFMFASFGSISCSTGRMSCSKPNLQQMPKSISKIIEPREGHVFCDADFAQIELRILVALAEEWGLVDYFKDYDADMHSKLASMLFDLPFSKVDIPDETGKSPRQQCKGLNFGIPYGMGIASLAITLYGVATKQTKEWAKAKYDRYFLEMPAVKEFFVDVKEKAQVTEYSVTHFGRRRWYKFTDNDGNYSPKHMAMALRQAGNAVIQGCLHGDTRIQTKEYGIVKIKDVVGLRPHVWDGYDWTLGDITDSGMKQKCIVTFSTGQKIVCSPIHKFLVKSSKGNKRFVECRNLHGKDLYKANAHRVVINQRYEPSDWVYESTFDADNYGLNHKANNASLSDIGDSFKAGVVLGRLASDGSVFDREVGGSSIRQFVAEHEREVLYILEDYMKNLGAQTTINKAREDRNEAVHLIEVYSKYLVKEIGRLDIKHKIHDEIFKDTELLRGFLRGLFDGDGGICGESIVITFGGQYDFTEMTESIQKALLFFGIKSSIIKSEYQGHSITKVCIRKHDNQRFAELIGFINSEKQDKAEHATVKYDSRVFGSELIVESVEVTDEYVQMYDVCNTERGYYVADGIITHNTAADCFKIGMTRIFTFIRQQKLLGKMLMSNFIHDEGLYEIDCRVLNVNKVLADILVAQQVQIKNWPPLNVGAGIGRNWASAKGGMAEINPLLGNWIVAQGENIDPGHTPEEVYKFYDTLNENFRKGRIRDYILTEQQKVNSGQVVAEIDPVMAKLMTLAFDNGVEKQMLAEAKELGLSGDAKETYMNKLDARRLRKFVELNPEWIGDNQITWIESVVSAGAGVVEEEEDTGYDEDDDETEGEITEYEFAMLDDSEEIYGLSIQDVIEMFGLLVSKERRLCGVDARRLRNNQIESLAKLFESKACDATEDGAMEVVLMRQNRILLRPGMWVKNITGGEVTRVTAAMA